MKPLFAAVVAGGVALSASGSAQTPPAGAEPVQPFPALLAEARQRVPSAPDVSTINTTLSTAEWLWRTGDQSDAVSYLNFARGRLGLSLLPPAIRDIRQSSRPAGGAP